MFKLIWIEKLEFRYFRRLMSKYFRYCHISSNFWKKGRPTKYYKLFKLYEYSIKNMRAHTLPTETRAHIHKQACARARTRTRAHTHIPALGYYTRSVMSPVRRWAGASTCSGTPCAAGAYGPAGKICECGGEERLPRRNCSSKLSQCVNIHHYRAEM